mmetsp:Transcript_17635/g.53779  ORF Transcript_17635/g.53779 Transcript_17635/m.53779 type:complete len:227 (+) Transcript_17635:128-808(+)
MKKKGGGAFRMPRRRSNKGRRARADVSQEVEEEKTDQLEEEPNMEPNMEDEDEPPLLFFLPPPLEDLVDEEEKKFCEAGLVERALEEDAGTTEGRSTKEEARSARPPMSVSSEAALVDRERTSSASTKSISCGIDGRVVGLGLRTLVSATSSSLVSATSSSTATSSSGGGNCCDAKADPAERDDDATAAAPRECERLPLAFAASTRAWLRLATAEAKSGRAATALL